MADKCPAHPHGHEGGLSSWLPSFGGSKEQAACPFHKENPNGESSTHEKKAIKPIPGPPGLPIVGNIFDMDFVTPLKTIEGFAYQYGACAQDSVTSFRQNETYIRSSLVGENIWS
ncbi:hypothetical protein ABW21_db0207074 [Orbilia brochopaga]|nr:hypothetical protein ABW21_db0207074 [Drechslerella brochopaga]